VTITADEYRARVVAASEEADRERAEMRLLELIPPRYVGAEMTNKQITDWFEQDFSTDPLAAPGLLITGPTGVGKTFEAYGVVKAIVRRFPQLGVIAGSTPALLAAARPGAPVKRRGSEAYGWDIIDPVEDMTSARLLFLDDLGAEKASEWTGEILYRVLDERYRQLRPTIVVSNVPPRELASAVGDRIASRLTEMCRTVVVKGADRRRAQ